MGGGAWTANDWNNYTARKGITNNSTVADIYKSKSMKANLNPNGVAIRESCDSADNPKSTGVIIGLDVTGSMGYLSETIAKGALHKLITEIYDRKPISDPHILIAAIGDGKCDSSPLQVTQFEAYIRLAEQLTDIYFESGGGGNGGESYLALWYFAAKHTKIDCFEKRGQKGFLFTIGDEPDHKTLTKDEIKRIFGDDVEKDYTEQELLDEVSRKYEVFHLCVGGYANYGSHRKWKATLGERAFEVSDHEKIPEIIESTMEVLAGKSVDDAATQWDGNTSLVVKQAISGLTSVDGNNGLVEM